MSVAYEAAEWSDLFVATAGAAAALAGLLFVAISINVQPIIATPGVPERALEAIVILLGALVVSLLGLAPGVGRQTLGALLLAEGAVIIVAIALLATRSARPGEGRSRRNVLASLVLSAIATVPFAVGGVSLLAGAGGGLYWTLGGIAGAFAAAILNAWVLLIEILR